MKFTTRPAEPGDAAAIAEVHVRSWQETYVGQLPQSYLDRLCAEGRTATWERVLSESASWTLVVALRGDRIVGFISVAPSRDDDVDPDRVGEVPAIYTRREVWRCGVGRRLIAEGLRLLGNGGFEEATLWVLRTNDRARAFYEACGWTLDDAAKDIEIGGHLVTEVRYRRRVDAEM